MITKNKHRGRVAWPALLTAIMLIDGLLTAFWIQPLSAGARTDGVAGLTGKVQGAHSPIAGSRVTLYAAGEGKPVQLAKGTPTTMGPSGWTSAPSS